MSCLNNHGEWRGGDFLLKSFQRMIIIFKIEKKILWKGLKRNLEKKEKKI